jgi:hypothetical protein
MKKLIIYSLAASLLTNYLWAIETQEVINTNIYHNLRESASELISEQKGIEITGRYKDSTAMEQLKSIITDRSVNRCATKTVSSIKLKLGLEQQKDVEEAILALRLNDELDDISAGLLIKASKLNSTLSHPIAHNDLQAEEETRALEIYKKEFSSLNMKTACLEEAYRSVVSELLSGSLKFKKNLKHINKLAFEKNIIDAQTFKNFELMRINKVHEWPITLATYATNIEVLSKHFPERKKEGSEVVTKNGKWWKNKSSLRQHLHERYNSTQIILLANIVRDMKKRLDSKNISVHIDYEEGQKEIINFSPMEKFRFILKFLRKELATINNGSILGGNQASYIEIISAAYEVGYITTNEIQQLAALEEIWNPKLSTKEKVMFWVKTFGGIASVFLPPPFGFVSVLAIMLIDQQVKEAPVNRDSDYNIL